MDWPKSKIDRRFEVPDHWIKSFYSYLEIEGEHPCNKSCPEPCIDCKESAKSLQFLARVVNYRHDNQLPVLLIQRAMDYNWENGPPEPPRRVASPLSR